MDAEQSINATGLSLTCLFVASGCLEGMAHFLRLSGRVRVLGMS